MPVLSDLILIFSGETKKYFNEKNLTYSIMWFKHQSTKTTLKTFSGKKQKNKKTKEQQFINKWKKQI